MAYTPDKTIAVYSGSFNPLHIGHLAIIRYMIEKITIPTTVVEGSSERGRSIQAQNAASVKR